MPGSVLPATLTPVHLSSNAVYVEKRLKLQILACLQNEMGCTVSVERVHMEWQSLKDCQVADLHMA